MFDIKIINGLIVDGTGKKAFAADLAINGDKIAAIGDLSKEDAKKVIDAKGQMVAPGFIDFHTHSDYTILFDQRACSRIHAGVTTNVIANCGIGLAPIRDERKQDLISYLSTRIVGTVNAPLFLDWNTVDEYFKRIESNPPAVNVVAYLAQGPVRIDEMGFQDGPASPEQLEHMKAEVVKAMEAGCVGLTSGLIYMPGSYTPKEEMAELCKAMAPYGGYYCTHIRDEGDLEMEALDEAIYIAKEGGVPLHVSHLKAMGAQNYGNVKLCFEKLKAAEAEGLEVSYDAYPYSRGMTSLGAFMPPWLFEGGVSNLVERLKVPELREKAKQDVINGLDNWHSTFVMCGGWKGVMIGSVMKEENKYMEGKTLQDLADDAGVDAFDFAFDLLISENGKVQVVDSIMDQADVDTVITDPNTMIGSDSCDFAHDGILNFGKPHPRAYGTTGVMFRRYVRELGLLTNEDVVRKMTSLPAKRLGIANERGTLKEGYFADIVIFDPETISDVATYADPKQYSVGIDTVIVNGQVSMENGVQLEDVHAGRLLRRK